MVSPPMRQVHENACRLAEEIQSRRDQTLPQRAEVGSIGQLNAASHGPPQALSLGGHVRKGERGTTVVYANRFTPNDERKRAEETGEEAQAIPFLKRFMVFNTD